MRPVAATIVTLFVMLAVVRPASLFLYDTLGPIGSAAEIAVFVAIGFLIERSGRQKRGPSHGKALRQPDRR